MDVLFEIIEDNTYIDQYKDILTKTNNEIDLIYKAYKNGKCIVDKGYNRIESLLLVNKGIRKDLIISNKTKKSKVSKKEIYNYCIELKNEK